MRSATPFPHLDIADEGPPITVALCASTRDADEYWTERPADHSERGLFVGGPEEGMTFLAKAATLILTRSPEKAEGPLGAMQRMARQKSEKLALYANQQRFLAAVAGHRVRPSRAA